jgi:8-oxo-dGTP pyrophosphatase MutT (NUDIX family)
MLNLFVGFVASVFVGQLLQQCLAPQRAPRSVVGKRKRESEMPQCSSCGDRFMRFGSSNEDQDRNWAWVMCPACYHSTKQRAPPRRRALPQMKGRKDLGKRHRDPRVGRASSGRGESKRDKHMHHAKRPAARPDTHRATHKKLDVDKELSSQKSVHLVFSSIIGDLLIMRSTDTELWEFPGGKCRHGKHGDGTPWNTGAREAAEELGTLTPHGTSEVHAILENMRLNPDVRICLVWDGKCCVTILIVLPVNTRQGVMNWLKLNNRNEHHEVRMKTQHSEEHTGYAFVHWTELRQGNSINTKIGGKSYTFELANWHMYHTDFIAAIGNNLP